MKFGVREICDVVFKAKNNGLLGGQPYNAGQPVLYIDSAKASTLEGASTTVYAQGGKGNARLIAWEGEKTLTFSIEDALLSERSFAILSGADLIKKDSKEPISIHRYEEKTLNIGYSGGFVSGLYIENIKNVNKSKPCFVIGIGLNGQMFTLPENIFTYIEEDKKLSYVTYKPAHQFPIEIQQYLEAGITSIPVIVDYYEAKTSASYNYTIDAGNFAGNWYVEAETSFRRQADGKDLKAVLTFPNVKVQSNFTFSMAATGDPSTFTFTMDAFPGYTMFDSSKKVLCTLQILDEEVKEKQDTVKNDSISDYKVRAYYFIFEDAVGQEGEEYTNVSLTDDIDAAWWIDGGYRINNEGKMVLTISNEMEGTVDIGYYIGTYEHEGQTYDKWQVIEKSGQAWFDWDHKKYVLTSTEKEEL